MIALEARLRRVQRQSLRAAGVPVEPAHRANRFVDACSLVAPPRILHLGLEYCASQFGGKHRATDAAAVGRDEGAL